jgi:hypothetical protein
MSAARDQRRRWRLKLENGRDVVRIHFYLIDMMALRLSPPLFFDLPLFGLVAEHPVHLLTINI